MWIPHLNLGMDASSTSMLISHQLSVVSRCVISAVIFTVPQCQFPIPIMYTTNEKEGRGRDFCPTIFFKLLQFSFNSWDMSLEHLIRPPQTFIISTHCITETSALLGHFSSFSHHNVDSLSESILGHTPAEFLNSCVIHCFMMPECS